MDTYTQILQYLLYECHCLIIHPLNNSMVEIGKIFKQGEQASMHLVGLVCDVCMCVSVYPPPQLLITSGVIWHDMNPI